MQSPRLIAFVLTVVIAAGVALALFPLPPPGEQPVVLLLLIALGAVAGARPIRIASLKTSLTATHPVILAAVAAAGAWPAALIGLVGVISASIGGGRRPAPHRLAFNLGAVILAATAAAASFTALGGRQGIALDGALLPLLGATTVYFAVNTGLVAAALALEQRQGFAVTWTASFPWTAAAYFTGFSVAVVLLMILQTLGPWGLVLGALPCWLLAGFYRAHQGRLHEKEQRVVEVEQLNARLETKVVELQSALDHVQQLQGLLPICMHCKNIRDDHDAWHRIESYISQHSEARFTHTLCDHCRDEHYPQVASRRS